jgi:FtsP/CotA-like multicopper oxidase with cupredoxin domain
MRALRECFAWSATLVLCFSLPMAPAQQHLPPGHAIHPTVTAEMANAGGKFNARAPDPARTRRYYVAAEPQLWDYAPEGSDVIFGKPLPPQVAANHIGSKLRYVQYTDETFQAKVIDSPRIGLLGPVLRGVVGDYLAITFLNRTSRPLSMHPHGLKYDKDSEGSYYLPEPGLGAAVGPGARFTYVWHIDEDAGPRPGEPSSKGWLYHSHVHSDEEINLGLVGFVIVTDPRRARPDGTPADVDREMAALFMIFDESGLGEAEKEAAEYGLPSKSWTQVQEMLERGSRYAINGYVFGNHPGLDIVEGERVRWYLFGLGSENDLHTAHWHGLRVVEEGRRRTDVVDLLPATMKVADMVADNPGKWLFHCHVAEHMMEGMFARLVVHPKSDEAGHRGPQPAFLGLPQAQQSLLIRRAEAKFNPAPESFELKIEGTVTVYEAFSVFVEPVRIQLGEKSVTLKPDVRGLADATDGSFRAKNLNQSGVVFGGLMEFEVALKGAEWLSELRKLGLKADATGRKEISVPLTVQIGRAIHSATARVVVAP